MAGITAVHKVLWGAERLRTLIFCLVALSVAVSIAGFLAAGPADAKTFTVDITSDISDPNLDDDVCVVSIFGGCTLRAAIQQANATSGRDTIEFNIDDTSSPDCNETTRVCTISPDEELPAITDTVTIDGYTQPDAFDNSASGRTNAQLKIELDGSNIDTFVDGLTVRGAPNSVIRGLVINSFRNHGILLIFSTSGTQTTGVRITGNFIGTDPSGTVAEPNGSGGIQVFGDEVSGNIIGGTSAEAANLISGNGGNGVWLRASNNKVLGNVIGTERDGSSALGNFSAGVQILPGKLNTIKGNIIAFSRFDPGVLVQSVTGNPSTGNRILNNSIFSNDGLGIDLVDPDLDGVTANDPLDSDKGPNKLQNFPELLSATTNNPDGTSVIRGRLRSQPSRTYIIQFFQNEERDTSGFGEGETFIGQTTLTTNTNGTAPFTFRLPRLLSPGVFVTGTATNKATGDTSEFSLAREVTVAP